MDAAQLKEHTLNRLGYGQGKVEAADYDLHGFAGYVERQTNGTLPPLVLTAPYVSTKITAPFRRDSPGPIRQLELVLTDFWFNHFNVDSGADAWLPRLNTDAGARFPEYHNEAIAPFVLGDFRDMLLATAKSVSMLDYLDNRFNFVPSTTGSPNENYAREVMELHTVSVTGGYTDDDVVDAARILTGWSYPESPAVFFEFKPDRHDFDAKTVMGVDYPAGRGQIEGEEFLGFLADHPATANHLAYKLCQRLVSETPSPSVVAAAAAAYSGTRDLKALTLAIINHPDFVDVENFRSKVKPPHRFVASALLAVGVGDSRQIADIKDALVAGILQTGERPYFQPSPNGVPESSAYWVSTSSMVTRFELAATIANDGLVRRVAMLRTEVDGVDVDATVAGLVAAILPGGASATTIDAVTQYTASQAMPDERVSAAIYMLLSSPEFLRY